MNASHIMIELATPPFDHVVSSESCLVDFPHI